MKDKFFVPFETAKALKEAGYNEPTIFYYDSDDYGKELLAAPSYFCGYSNEQWNKPINGGGRYISAPTYHEVEDWLEGKGQIVQAGRADENWYGLLGDACDRDVIDLGSYSTREEALNAAILKALELI